MGWMGVERWRGKTPHGVEWNVTLLQLESLPPFPGGTWRVEWFQTGAIRSSKSFPADQEQVARDFCAAKRGEFSVEQWENLSAIDIRPPDPTAGQRPPAQ